MIRIEIVNNGKEELPFGTFDYKVIGIDDKTKEEVIHKTGVLTEVLTGLHGWVALVSCLDKDINGDRWKE